MIDSLRPLLLALLTVFTVNASAQISEIDLPANAIAYSVLTKNLYATIAVTAGPPYGGKLVEISSSTGQISNSVSLDGEPGPLAISTEGALAYVGLKGLAEAQAINLLSLSASSAFPTPSHVQQIVVLPNAPATIAVSMGSGGNGTVAVFDNGILRSTTNNSVPGANSIAFDTVSNSLFGFDNYDTNFTLSEFSIGSTGVSLMASVYNMIRGFGATIVADNGLIYASTGAVVDAAQLSLVGTYQSSGPLVVDDANHAVIFAHGNTLQIFDRNTFVPTFSRTLQNARGNPIDATACGPACVGVVFDSG